MPRQLASAIAACLVALVPPLHAAEPLTPSLIPIEDFARQPKLRSIAFSPDGKRFAAVQEANGRMNLSVVDIKERKLNRVTNYSTYDVRGYQWISNSRLIFGTYDATKGLAEQRSLGSYAINWDGSEPRTLSSGRPITFYQRIANSEDEIIAVGYERDIETADLYRYNTRTGRKTLLTDENPGKVKRWVLDQNDIPRAAVSEDPKQLGETFWYRDSGTAAWRKISTATGFAKRMSPAAFDSDGTLLVYSNLDSDRYRLHTFDAATGKPGAVVAEHATANIDDGVIKQFRSRKVIGVRIDADRPETVWFDEGYARIQALMDVSLPKGHQNEITPMDDGSVLVYSWSDRDPGTYYLFDPQAKALQELLRPIDWIKPERMSAMQVLRYKARDGLEIPSYLTLPVGKAATKLPLVAWIHGGPWARDHWGWNPDVQFLASRGYAVWQPNYRGSTGFGARHFSASFKQLGQAMQDDITDGIRYLIAQGFVDADRVCIGGGSYGGYATMMGLVKEPSLFRCGINEAGVVDLVWWQELGYTDFNQGSPAAAEAWFDIAIGSVKEHRAMLEQYSPRLHADKIKAPVLIIHGGGDQRVPIQHAQGMRAALKAADKEYEWVVYGDEGHGFAKPENRIDRYRKIEGFLQKHLAPRSMTATAQ